MPSCSKLFSGNLPELTYDVLKFLRNDYSTLYSCILVNRLWCRLAMPLLWENPFSISTGNYNFIGIYLHNLNGNLKSKLNGYGIGKLLPSTTLFNYPSFIRYLNTQEFIFSVDKWVEVSVKTLKPRKRYFIKTISLNLDADFIRLVHTSLLKIFIENEINLHTFDVEFTDSKHISYFGDILGLILQNNKFINNIRYLKLHTGRTRGFSSPKNKDTPIKHRVLQIINLHQNLKKILLSYDNFSLYQSLLLQSESSNCLKTLNTIILFCFNFNGIINLDKAFEQLNVLESVHIIYCSPLNTDIIQQIINLNKPFKLKSLFVNDRSQIDESLLLLLQKYGNYLENFGCGHLKYIKGELGLESGLSLKQQILESVLKYCKNIKFLDICGIKDEIVYLVLNLVENIKSNLNYLTIEASETSHLDNSSSILLRNLGRILPPKLEYLNLILYIRISDFEVFKNNSQNTVIKKLSIINNVQDYGVDISPYIKEYIVDKRTKYYLAFRNIKIEDLKGGEIKKFESYIAKRDNDLSIDIYQFIKNLD
ncbi:hypothetical protein RhiirA1_541360 [Rhizophagus irregularis]|uniref:F-box domain-containing protein n=1 Tax=Rhizophagus irregularis TaxID=588596 RepID=A0A2N0R3P4_9GLOM|nr:hypothetical protein RhiirA1_541360 [Rhizophagus irregularis]